jgi:hypothetical protein
MKGFSMPSTSHGYKTAEAVSHPVGQMRFSMQIHKLQSIFRPAPEPMAMRLFAFSPQGKQSKRSTSGRDFRTMSASQ